MLRPAEPPLPASARLGSRPSRSKLAVSARATSLVLIAGSFFVAGWETPSWYDERGLSTRLGDLDGRCYISCQELATAGPASEMAVGESPTPTRRVSEAPR